MKKTAIGVFLVLVGIFVPAVAYGQSNVVIDDLLEQDIAQAAEVSYVVLGASGDLAEEASTAQALSAARDRGFFRQGDDVRLGQLSYALMATFDMPGGIMYSLVPGPRYATRELAFYGLIPGRTHPNRRLSGFEALQLVERFLNWRENG